MLEHFFCLFVWVLEWIQIWIWIQIVWFELEIEIEKREGNRKPNLAQQPKNQISSAQNLHSNRSGPATREQPIPRPPLLPARSRRPNTRAHLHSARSASSAQLHPSSLRTRSGPACSHSRSHSLRRQRAQLSLHALSPVASRARHSFLGPAVTP